MNLDIAYELKAMLRRARGATKSRGLDVDLDVEHLSSLWEEQGGRCAVSGLPFTRETYENAFVKTPFAPSVDRVDCSKGYLKGNVRLVCVISNFALNEWGDNVLRRLAHGVVATEKEVHKVWFRNQKRKLHQAEAKVVTLTGSDLVRQRRVIAGLKRALTMGPARLGGAALTANRTMRPAPAKGRQ
tara:strand:+ start:1141 stop:1698 length:558 start_codon:yes stop_codon:yes gene_type:complete